MKHYIVTLLLIGMIVFVVGCESEDEPVAPTFDDPIVGSWVSEGQGNVAQGLIDLLDIARIDATFRDNMTYEVDAVDSAGTVYRFSGTYEVTEHTGMTIRSIRLSQNVPVAIVSEGIYEVVGDRMTYEVIQVQPPLEGFTPPTPQEGFGSTKYQGFPLGTYWIQRYTRTN